MRLLRRLVLAAAASLAAAPAAAQSGATLRVVRTSPSGDASPSAAISVTFDRPVAGSLDRTVDPTRLLRVVPAVPGKLEWRDAVTLRLLPAGHLTPGQRYQVTVANDFRAMDGSALAAPHQFGFRVQGPTLVGGSPVGPNGGNASHLVATQKFELVYSAPVDLAVLSRTAYLEFSTACAGPRIVRLTATSQRRTSAPTPEDDAYEGRRRPRDADTLQRAVQLVPQVPLPRGCSGSLVVPTELGGPEQALSRLSLSTHGDFRIDLVHCGPRRDDACPTGPIEVRFTTPVRGSEVQRRLKLLPATKFVVRDTAGESTSWTLEAKLSPRVAYAVVADTAMRDVFRQPLTGNPAQGMRTTGFSPTVDYPFGKLLVERIGFRTLAVQHVNVDTLVATIAPVPLAVEARLLGRFGWGSDSIWTSLLPGATVQRIPVRNIADRPMVTGVRLPVLNAARAGTPTLFAVRIAGAVRGSTAPEAGPVALLQLTDLGVHVKAGPREAAVWVTGVADGAARANALVELHDGQGRLLATARTDAEGIARMANWPVPAAPADGDEERTSLEGYVAVTLGADRAITALNNYDPDLSPWRFNVSGAWGDARLPLAGALFTERGIYRPGERVYAKAIVRDGPLGALRAPAAGDSIKWEFADREEGTLRAVTSLLSAFGTSDQSLLLPAATAVGEYGVSVHVKRLGAWRRVGYTSYRVAEYRPPEFLVDVTGDRATRLPGDRITAQVQARYLFGAPMGRAAVHWTARRASISMWELEVPGTDGWYLGESGNWWEDYAAEETDEFASRADTLDTRGGRAWTLTLPPAPKGRASRVTLEATVTDVNRQTVSSRIERIVHPATFYIAAKPAGRDYFWKSGVPQRIDVRAVRPDGRGVAGVRVTGTIVRREWHRVRRERDGISELVGEWVSDTVSRCIVTTAASAVPCSVTPAAGGIYLLSFTARDEAGRTASTSFERWAASEGWVPWSDETQFRMDVIPDRTRYAVGDTATIMFASPFTNAEAWITVEREGLIQQRRIRITSGSTTIRLPVTEALAPNAFVSIVVARGRSAPPGSLDDAGRPTIRVGYTELRVTPETKRLTISLQPDQAVYRPADTARVQVRLRTAQGRGVRGEVTLWAVDEGVLSLTGYTTPDPIDLLYQRRGLGMRLASNMTSVAPQIPEGEKGRREAGGGGGADGGDILRSRFQTTAFFMGSVVTDASGNATAVAKLPDNLTTFRVMAVAVTTGDRYGKGQSSMLVTRPLLARQALPRFVRPGDTFAAGAVVNRRDGSAAAVTVTTQATGVELQGDATQTATLAALRGTEVRFPFRARQGDSASFRFDVTDGSNADAVRIAIPVRPDHHPLARTVAGVLRDSTTVELALPAGIDPDRSRLSLSVGASPMATIRGMARSLRVYPYYCSEQVLSTAVPLIALHRAQKARGAGKPEGDPLREVTRAVEILSSRQRADGGIGYWSSTDWSSAWLSAYAGMVLLDARDLGVKVDTMVLSRLAGYVTQQSRGEQSPRTFAPTAMSTDHVASLHEQVAAVDFMSRFGRPLVSTENELLRSAAQMSLEDRARLAEVLARRGQAVPARTLMQSVWASVRTSGRRAELTDTTYTRFYFESRMRPLARVLTATLAVAADHPLVGPMAETLAMQSRTSSEWTWNTQDYASAVTALAELDRRRRAQGDRAMTVRLGDRTLMQWGTGAAATRDSTISLRAALGDATPDAPLRLSLRAGAGEVPIYYYVTLTEVPLAPPVTPLDNGIRVERWYERVTAATPVSSAAEGELVRVRLRITVPDTRYFVVLDDALPAGLEAVDLSLRTAAAEPGPGKPGRDEEDEEGGEGGDDEEGWYGRWDGGWWTPFEHSEMRDDRVVYSATRLWKGTYTATYLARATTPGTFIRPPAHAEEMYNPAANGRSDGGTFTVTAKAK